jgi:hypothetical protein
MRAKTQSKTKKSQKHLDAASKFFLQLGLGTYQERSRFLPVPGNNLGEKKPSYIPSLSGSSQPLCITES